jgi:predicted metal-dependent phosphoesterase TrpH
MTDRKVDLHLHTRYSDGFYTPHELIAKAKGLGISTLSITDHDSVDSFEEASTIARQENLSLISGAEFTTYIDDREIHILGYFFDTKHPELTKILSFFKSERTHRAERILWKLKNHGISIQLDEVLQEANSSPVTRPHIASIMMEKGVVKSYMEAFNLYLGNHAPCYEKKIHVDPATVFETISTAGGLSFLAHPSNMPEETIRKLIDAGVDGIEVIHPSHTPAQERYFREIAELYFLLQSGGSDYHGGKKNDDNNLGSFFITESYVANMRKRLVKARLA